ncbi:acetyltransferase [Nakamurella sp.]|uniref:acetyltransferase n=1 Tax=Nakamurella sp. TaxID=1869182 RepID=UPI003783AB9A
MNRDLVIIGCGGFGREVWGLVAALREAGSCWRVAGFVDDDPSPVNLRLVERLGSAVIGAVDVLAGGEHAAVAAVGDPTTRRRIVEGLAGADLEWPVLIHPHATVGPDVSVTAGTVIAAGARLSVNVQVGRHVHVDQNATVGHDSSIGAYSRLNPQVCLSGEVSLGEEVLAGANATILPGLTVGDGAVIGAGAVVVRDVAAGSVVKGVPAR